ncbi:MAG: peroxiredoxin [Cyclonatronaceae bacterium]
MPLKNGDIAPDFTLTDQDGKVMKRDDLLADGPLVLFFYPKDDSPGCTQQACSFRDNYGALLDHGVVVAGISKDTEGEHGAFIGKHQLPYPLLSDPTGEVHKAYGVLTLFGTMTRRVTYLIGSDSVIQMRHEDNFRMNSHVHAVLKALQAS